jgi:hypothetical protein
MPFLNAYNIIADKLKTVDGRGADTKYLLGYQPEQKEQDDLDGFIVPDEVEFSALFP